MRLEIKDMAVISNVVFEPKDGLNVITGETGAGKSLLVDAIGLIMGKKASRGIIRSGKDKATVEAFFDVSRMDDIEFRAALNEYDITPDNEMLILSRTVYDNGRSISRINGQSVTLNVFREITSFLVDIHGQHDTQKIFEEKSHVNFLDRFGGETINALLGEYRKLLAEYKDTVHKIRDIGSSPDYIERRREYLKYVIEDIENANFQKGEDDELFEKKKKMESYEAFASDMSEANTLMSAGTDNVSRAASLVSKVAANNPEFSALSVRLDSAMLELESVLSEVNEACSEIDFDEEEKEAVDKRIGTLFELKSKYGNTIEEINDFRDKSQNELSKIDSDKDLLGELKIRRTELEKQLLQKAEELSKSRKETAADMEVKICEELSDLEMPSAVFKVVFEERPKERYFANFGTEDITFKFSANPGQELRNLSAIASGGEASRIMLAIKNILSEVDKTPTLIFDEIDIGVSGKASVGIAAKLKSIGKTHQVLCVTHTAQIAAIADENYVADKEITENTTVTQLKHLNYDEKVSEVSRLLSGNQSDESVALAKHLIDSLS